MGRIMTVFDIDFGKYEEKCHAQHMEVEFNSDVYPPRIVLTQEQTLFDVGTQQEQTRETEIVVVGGVEPEKAAEYAGVSRPTLYNLLKRPTAYFPQTLRLMRALSIPVEEMRAAISYPW